MKKLIFLICLIFPSNYLQAQDNLKFYIQKALSNNLQLNAERKNFESAKQSKNISRSEFLPSVTLSGNQTSTTSTNQTNKSGTILSDSNSDSESKKISVDQKIFSGFKGLPLSLVALGPATLNPLYTPPKIDRSPPIYCISVQSYCRLPPGTKA